MEAEGPDRVSVWKIMGRAGKSVIVTDTLSSNSSTASLVYSVQNGGIWDNCVVDYPILDCTSSRVRKVKAKAERDKPTDTFDEPRVVNRLVPRMGAKGNHRFKNEINKSVNAVKGTGATGIGGASADVINPSRAVVKAITPAWYQGEPHAFDVPPIGVIEVKYISENVIGIKTKIDQAPAVKKLLGTAISAKETMGGQVYFLATGVKVEGSKK